jgi:hypothetical protein
MISSDKPEQILAETRRCALHADQGHDKRSHGTQAGGNQKNSEVSVSGY